MSMPTAPDTLRVMPILPAVFTLERAHELLATLTNEAQSDAVGNSPREDDDD
jgi:hypothetical protein